MSAERRFPQRIRVAGRWSEAPLRQTQGIKGREEPPARKKDDKPRSGFTGFQYGNTYFGAPGLSDEQMRDFERRIREGKY